MSSRERILCFGRHSVCHGLSLGEFDALPRPVKKKLVRLMARLAEKSYRRGFQHGIAIGHDRTIDPSELRFKRSLDKSPFTDGPGGHSAIERLFMECSELKGVGLPPPTADQGT